MKILIFQRYPNYHFIADFAADFVAAGHEVLVVPARDGPKLRLRVEEWKPQCVFCIGASPAVGRALASVVPIVYYELDKILNLKLFAPGELAPEDRVFITYRDDESLFRGFGFRHVSYLPFCVNLRPQKCPLSPRRDSKYGVSFVGSLVRQQLNEYYQLVQAMRELASRDPDWAPVLAELLRRFESVLGEQERSFATGEYVIPRALRSALSPEQVRTLVRFQIPLEAAINTLGKEAAGRQRLYWLGQLASADLWGSEGPGTMLPGCRYHGPVDQYSAGAEVFRDSAINLNLQRIYARDGLSDRVFNVLYAGGCLLADRTDSMTELFADEEEIETYASPDELKHKVERLNGDPDRRRKIALCGQRKVWAKHLFRHRIPSLLDAFK